MFDFNRNYTISPAKYVLLSKLRLATVSIAAHEGRHAGQPAGTWGPWAMGHGPWAMAALPGVSTGSGMPKCRRAGPIRDVVWSSLAPITVVVPQPGPG